MATATVAADSHAVVLGLGWANPHRAYAITGDGAFASAVPAKSSTTSGDFGFPDISSATIPDASTINSVIITVEWALSALVTGGILGCQGRVDGANAGTEITKTTTVEEQAVFTFSPVPTLADLRAASTDIKARMRCAKGSTNSALTADVDFISLTVDYTEPVLDEQFPYVGGGYYP